MIAGDVLGLPVAGCKDDKSVNSREDGEEKDVSVEDDVKYDDIKVGLEGCKGIRD